jgi:hypothetical protein
MSNFVIQIVAKELWELKYLMAFPLNRKALKILMLLRGNSRII